MDIYNIETKIDYMEEGAALRELAEKILKASEELFENHEFEEGNNYPVGVSVVPVSNSNRHNYPLGVAYVCYGRQGSGTDLFYETSDGVDRRAGAASWNGHRGNNMSKHREDVRCPTIEELEIYLYDLFTNKSEYYEAIAAMECYQ